MDIFTKQYIKTALWSTNDDYEEPLDSNYSLENIHPETIQTMEADCNRFQIENRADIGEEKITAGHDFWLTRNGHGAGFWDGDWPEPAATRLTNASKTFGEFNLYVGDSGEIFCI